MSILGGFQGLIYTSSTKTGSATNRGVITRISPILEPNVIEVPGTGARGFYDLLLGMPEPQISLDIKPTDISFITAYQNGQTVIPFLHMKYGSLGLTLTNVYFNRTRVECRHNDSIGATIEMWAESGETLASASWGSVVVTPYRWFDSQFWIAGVLETQWWEWFYEVVTNLQRLGNVQTRGTREIDAKHRRVTGQIIKDLRSYSEYLELLDVAAAEPSKFITRIRCATTPGGAVYTDLLNKECRWGRLEAPTGPEDLGAKRFPFTALDLS